jgi:predicted acylesterase/phospholipase RssA
MPSLLGVSALEKVDVTPITSNEGGGLAVMLTGGGARAAYQVGLLQGLAQHFPDPRNRREHSRG